MTIAQTLPEGSSATPQAGRLDVGAARQAGAEAADLVIRAQLNSGMTQEQIRASAERVLGDRLDEPSPASDAFYAAYDETAETYVAEMSEPEPGDIEAG